MNNTDNEKLEFLKQNDLFSGLSHKQFKQLIAEIKEFTVDQGEFIIHENEIGDQIFIIKEGEVEIARFDKETKCYHHLGVLGKGAVIGEISLIDNAPRSASVRTTRPTIFYTLSISRLRLFDTTGSAFSRYFKLSHTMNPFNRETSIYSTLIQNIAKNLSHRIRATNDAVVIALKKELLQSQARAAMSGFIINTLVVLSFYIFVMRILSNGYSLFISTSFLSVPLIIVFAIPLIYMMKQSGYPLSVYGLTTKNWQYATLEAILLTIPLFLIIVIYKWILIHTSPNFESRHIFDMTLNLTPLGKGVHLSFWLDLLLVTMYCVFVPLQEIIVRGALQSSFQMLLVGRYKIFLSIILSNLLFSVTHVHISIGFGLIVYLPGLFWGWLYARQKTLVGVSVSHLITGIWAIFVVGLL